MLLLPQVIFRFRVAYYLYWAMSAALLGYWVVYLETERHSPADEIGVIMSLYTGAALIGQYSFGYVSDRLRSIRILVAAAAFLFSILAGVIPQLTSTTSMCICLMMLGFLQQPIGPMLDSWALKHLIRHDQQRLFGSVRSFGSLGWATSALLTSWLIIGLSWNFMFVIATITGLLLSIVVFWIPDATDVLNEHRSEARPKLSFGRAMTLLSFNSSFRYILAVVFLMYLGVQTTFNFQGLIIKGTGGGVQELGWTYFLGVLSEVPAMVLSVWLAPRAASRKVMIFSGILYMLRYGLIIYFQSPAVIMATACIEGIAFGLLLTSLRSYVFSVVDEDVQTLAMTVVDATFLGLTVLVGGVVGGWIIETTSVISLVATCAVSSGLALVLLLLGKRFDRRPQTSDG